MWKEIGTLRTLILPGYVFRFIVIAILLLALLETIKIIETARVANVEKNKTENISKFYRHSEWKEAYRWPFLRLSICDEIAKKNWL